MKIAPFTDKVIVITGASRGLGASLAELLASKGARVVISGRNQADLATVAAATGAVSFPGDVTRQADMVALAAAAVAKFGRLDIWINNAGVWLPRAALEDTDLARAHDMVEINLFGTAYGCLAALMHMKKQGSGTIVNIVSTSALSGRPQSVMYSASKWAARGFTDSLREELKAENAAGANAADITVIGVYPGGIKTHLFDEKKPADFDDFMSAESVAAKIVDNLEADEPALEQVLRRAGQK